jgi:hypothetical protein
MTWSDRPLSQVLVMLVGRRYLRNREVNKSEYGGNTSYARRAKKQK